MQKPEQSCECCLSREVQPFHPGLRRCLQCGHAFADLRMSDEELRALYAANYFEGGEYLDYGAEAAALRKNFDKRLRRLRKLSPEGGRLLDLGCAYGFFLQAAAPYFEVTGCDISQHAVDRANTLPGVRAHCVDYLQWEAEAPFDLVCLWDTVEHLPSPAATLAKVYEDLLPGGHLALSTGDIGALPARLRGAKWRQIHPPTHLHYFTVHSMRTLLQRLGFENIHISHPPFWRTADAVAYKLLREGWLYQGLKKTGALKIAFPFQSFDLMYVEARKP